MVQILIRPAELTDNFFKIAECLYLTDPYIYPSAFGFNKEKALSAITTLVKQADGLLSYKNIHVAVIDEIICGVLLHNENGSFWDTEIYYSLIKDNVPDKEQFVYAANNYFIESSAKPAECHIDIVALCVLPEYRHSGVAGALLSEFSAEKKGMVLALDVLADNKIAIHTYEKAGFFIESSYKGFGLTIDTRPDCYHMVKNK